MGEPRHLTSPPLVNPPKGSVLAKALAQMDPTVVENAHKSGHTREDAKVVALALLELEGRPEGPIEKWLEPPLAAFTEAVFEVMQQQQKDELRKRSNRKGRPPSFGLPHFFVVASFLRQTNLRPPGASLNSIFKTVAEELGPGLDRDHVRRAVLKFYHLWGLCHYQEKLFLRSHFLFYIEAADKALLGVRRTQPKSARA